MSTHGTCTAVFVICSAILGFILASIRTMGHISWVAWVGVASILASRMFSMLFVFMYKHALTDIQSSLLLLLSGSKVDRLLRRKLAPGSRTTKSVTTHRSPMRYLLCLQSYSHIPAHRRSLVSLMRCVTHVSTLGRCSFARRL